MSDEKDTAGITGEANPHEPDETRDFGTGAVRHSSKGKGRYDLIPTRALRRLARIYEYGAERFAPRNWEEGMPASVLLDSGIRHLCDHLEGKRDEDHLARAVWNVFALMHFEDTERVDLLDTPGYDSDERFVDIRAKGQELAEKLLDTFKVSCTEATGRAAIPPSPLTPEQQYLEDLRKREFLESRGIDVAEEVDALATETERIEAAQKHWLDKIREDAQMTEAEASAALASDPSIPHTVLRVHEEPCDGEDLSEAPAEGHDGPTGQEPARREGGEAVVERP